MWQFSDRRELELVAHKKFPFHLSITEKSFIRARSDYFDKVKSLDHYTKNLFFKNTYYSEGPLCWFILEDYKYFSFNLNAGNATQFNYYGVVKMELLTPRYY